MSSGLHAVIAAVGLTDQHGEPKYGLQDRGGRELPAKIVQGLLGHSSIGMTLDRYGHLFPRGDDRAELAAAETAMFA